MKSIRIISILLILIFSAGIHLNAQKTKEYLLISGTRFTYPLLEKWVEEFKKSNPQARIKLQYNKAANDSINLSVIAHTPSKGESKPDEVYLKVSKYALLPIANERNADLKKAFKKGFKQEDLKKIFFNDSSSYFQENTKKQFSSTVYARTGIACSSIAFAHHFGFLPSEIKGKKISGEDQYLTSAIQKDTTGLTYNNLGYIFDLRQRVPVKGIKVVPIDLNENGKIDKEEQIFDNLDNVTNYLEENLGDKSIPTDYISFIFKKNAANETLNKFVNWVLTEGQQYNHSYGFLNNDKNLENLSQNLSL
jgi:phosphate transport system substrate-binding protein